MPQVNGLRLPVILLAADARMALCRGLSPPRHEELLAACAENSEPAAEAKPKPRPGKAWYEAGGRP